MHEGVNLSHFREGCLSLLDSLSGVCMHLSCCITLSLSRRLPCGARVSQLHTAIHNDCTLCSVIDFNNFSWSAAFSPIATPLVRFDWCSHPFHSLLMGLVSVVLGCSPCAAAVVGQLPTAVQECSGCCFRGHCLGRVWGLLGPRAGECSKR